MFLLYSYVATPMYIIFTIYMNCTMTEWVTWAAASQLCNKSVFVTNILQNQLDNSISQL